MNLVSDAETNTLRTSYIVHEIEVDAAGLMSHSLFRFWHLSFILSHNLCATIRNDFYFLCVRVLVTLALIHSQAHLQRFFCVEFLAFGYSTMSSPDDRLLLL